MSFQIVTRKPIQAFLFEGGAANATPIINQILQNGDTATWTEGFPAWESPDGSEGHPAKSECILVVFGPLAIEVLPGMRFIYEDGMYQLYDHGQFRRAFDTAPGTPDFEVKEKPTTPAAGVRSFVTKAFFAEAIQVPVKTFQEADKDLEERMRAVAAFVVNNGGEVSYMAKDWLDVNLDGHGAEGVAGPDWIVKNPEGKLEHLEDAKFQAKYQEVEA
jgi:hypothetical protein